MSKDFEVVVVGAGPAGAMMTLELAKRKFKVLCIEREFEVGYPNKSTATTPTETFELFEIPLSLAFEGLAGLRMQGPTETFVGEFEQSIGRLLDFRGVKQYLIKEAIKLGAVTMLGTRVLDVVKENDQVVGLTYDGFDGDGIIKADVIVDASGPSSVLATKLGLWKQRSEELGVALEYFLDNASPDKAKNGFYLDFYIGSKSAPGGYAWIYPTNDHQVKAGICKLNPPFKVDHEKDQKEYFYELWESNHQIKKAQAFEIHRCAHYITGGVWDCVRDNFLAIGDAVNKVNPVFGEGVRPSFYSARFAAEAIEAARKKKDYSRKSLKLYDDLWKQKWKGYTSFPEIVFKLLYASDDDQLDRLMRAMPKLPIETWYRLYLGKGSKEDNQAFIKVLPSIVDKKMLFTLVKNFKF